MLREQLDADLKAALRQHDALRLSLIRQVKASVLAQETRGRRVTLDDPDILAVIAKEIKEREEVLPDFERGGRADLVEKARAEIAVLEEYLPPKLSDADLQDLVEAAVREVGAEGPRDMGRVMAVLTPKTRGRADGRTVSELVRARLSP
jgi:uncharacterized protein YqeY